MGLYLFYFLGLLNILTYIKLKKEIKKNEDLYEQLYSSNKKNRKSSSQITKYILSPKKWGDSISPELRFWLKISRTVTLGYIMYGTLGIIFFLITSLPTSTQ